MNLTLETEENGTLLLSLSGRVSQREILGGREPLLELLGEDGYRKRLAIDMSEVGTLDSSGVNWLLNAQRKSKAAGGTIVLHSLSPIANNVIRVLNLQTVLPVAAGVEEAKQILSGNGE